MPVRLNAYTPDHRSSSVRNQDDCIGLAGQDGGNPENGLGEIGNIVLQFELEKNGILTGYPGLDGQAQSCCLKSDPGREVRMNRYGDLGPLRDSSLDALSVQLDGRVNGSLRPLILRTKSESLSLRISHSQITSTIQRNPRLEALKGKIHLLRNREMNARTHLRYG